MSPRVIFCASLTLARILREQYNVPAMVKWPNDILVKEKKICGMLSEMEAEADQVNYLNIGVGLNVNNDPAQREPNAISLKDIIGRSVQRKEILSVYLDAFETHLKEYRLEGVVEEWKKYTVTLNRQVKIVTGSETIEGRAVDLDENGSLLLELDDGSKKTVFYGDCFHL
jgi:BirA family biotin operon repressor/biotin-[acetyl-CoA-carboxylase] ligase